MKAKDMIEWLKTLDQEKEILILCNYEESFPYNSYLSRKLEPFNPEKHFDNWDKAVTIDLGGPDEGYAY
tara:strand:- start:1390 stop:1596 length:207 start_codon:yes stop_codon:yes gene_type:complete